MYLREMGSVELLSREGEIAIAKRIEAGRDKMIGGICESPLTMRAIIAVARRPGRREDAAARHHRPRRHLWRRPGRARGSRTEVDPADAEAESDERAAARREAEGDENGEAKPDGAAEGDADGEGADEANLSLSAMESAAEAAGARGLRQDRRDLQEACSEVQEKRLEALHAGRSFEPGSEKTYEKLKAELVELMEGVRLNNNRIEQLVEQLYDLNRQLIGSEGRLLRLAESCGVKREEFLGKYYGNELDPRWLRACRA